MPKTRQLPYSETVAKIPVAGIRIAGRDRVYRFDEHCCKDGTVTIGRTHSRNLRIRDDLTVSRLHCVIAKNDLGRYEIVDSDSTNGIRIADCAPYKRYHKVRRNELQVGMRIKLGCTRLVVVGPGGEPVIAASRFRTIGRVALSIFGNISAAAGRLGLDHRRFKKLATTGSHSEPNGGQDE